MSIIQHLPNVGNAGGKELRSLIADGANQEAAVGAALDP